MEFNSVPKINATTEGNKAVQIYTHTLTDVAYVATCKFVECEME